MNNQKSNMEVMGAPAARCLTLVPAFAFNIWISLAGSTKGLVFSVEAGS